VITEGPSWYQPTALLTRAPLLIDPGDGRDALLAAALSEAGQEFIFAYGRTAFRQQLIESCAAGSDQAALSAIEWMFVDEAILSAADRNDRLQALLRGRQRPRLPDIIAHRPSGDGAEYLFHIPANLAWFDGHFPDEPILPAVVQVDWAIHFGQSLGFEPDQFAGFARLKFMAIIQPDMLVRLRMTTSETALGFAYESSAGLHSKGTVKFLGEAADE
jgi:3-hydroxymyristoyl/3-hydroxydecanoyl-(acyl carrier protein) dehydratase